ncbi:MAG: SDR family oxidoreductase [Proteobacteria bacterium]|nr:SDR family oxidoreductase [Pseudomonadota bacterium]MBU1585054.1 SDR family oxidoreductase [Pseudomonadota bacterium]MBU2456012.1 SDR family oxidoreductase [Pseudomonadota bacterium]MBU2627358.1 SDR family oxidoreductase [Pseudomonadota bacterium]
MENLIEKIISLNGKTAVITGGSSGIGAATARLLSQAGAGVVILDINQDQGETTASNIRDNGGVARFYACDITDETQVKTAAAFVKKTYQTLDILFNNAGVIVRKNVIDLEESEWDAVVDVSLKGTFLVSKHMIPLMKANGGSVINTGSGWSLKAGENAAAYCAAKAGVLNLTRAMAIDFGKYNIRVNCVCPGDTDTNLLRSEARQLGEDETVFLKQASARPLGRMGTPDDIAKSVLFLACPLSEWISGTSLLVDGGGLA